jgi:CRP-like cAMP-binding protein
VSGVENRLSPGVYDGPVRLRRDAKVELLRNVPLFSGCSKGELRLLAAIADELDLAEGTVLVREGATAREFFVLVEGSVRVTKAGTKLADLGPGDWLGEIAILARVPRTATATARSDIRTLVIREQDFRNLVVTMPSIALKVLTSVAERLTRTPQS